MTRKQQKENDTTAIQKIDKNQYAISKVSKEQIREAIQTNLGNESISGFDFERIKVPTGGSISWEMMDDDNEISYFHEVEGIIILIKPGRKFWEKGFDESEENSAPDCTSDNLINGIPTNPDSDGEYGGECNLCVMNTWGSGKNGKGKACKEVRIIFFLQKDNILPTVLIVPVTSLKPLKKYLTRLTQKMKPYNSVITRFTLSKVKNDSGISYSEISFSKIEDIDIETKENVKEYGEDLRKAINNSSITESILSE